MASRPCLTEALRATLAWMAQEAQDNIIHPEVRKALEEAGLLEHPAIIQLCAVIYQLGST